MRRDKSGVAELYREDMYALDMPKLKMIDWKRTWVSNCYKRSKRSAYHRLLRDKTL